MDSTNGTKELFIFDLDGTLVDAYKAIEQSLNFTRKKLGYSKVSYAAVKKNIGNGDRNFIAVFFPPQDVENALALYRRHHKGALKKYSYLKPYAKVLLLRLKQGKKITAIASNRPAAYTKVIIKAVGIDKYLDYVLCADQINSLKPKPKILYEILKKFKIKKHQAVYVGDMDVDMQTAERAKIEALFIAGGSSSIKDVKKYKNKKVIYSLKDVLKYCRN
ncbi:MAG: HAD-IA family hydrolase [Candidatus Omnitrophica bacterium]|nr:HAD-IA family hydrolase [Candidatus Omnitrophota bacterium]